MYCRLRDLREDHDMKQKDLAAYLNCSQQVYSNYELGQRDVPTDILIRLSQLYHVSVDYILGLSFGEEEINNLADSHNQVSATCNFCSEKYVFDKGELIRH